MESSVSINYSRRQDAQALLDSMRKSADYLDESDDVIVLTRDGVSTEVRITRRTELSLWVVTITQAPLSEA